MIGRNILVSVANRQLKRQIARALFAGGISVRFVSNAQELLDDLIANGADLAILDCDSNEIDPIGTALVQIQEKCPAIPVVLLSLGAEKTALLDLVRQYDVANLVAKHGAIRAAHPMLDERELMVTCRKVIQRDIFGIDKYVGSWGVVLHDSTITSIDDKIEFLGRFEKYLTDLDCPATIIPNIVTVVEELILNAMLHAPIDAGGQPKYETMCDIAHLVLAPDEHVRVRFGCDGQRLMLSVNDRFGRLDKKTLYSYLTRGVDSLHEPENKPGGAGLGLTMSYRSIHQLIFNIQEHQRTEVIAGWYLRIDSASEFRQVGKSLNLFWLPAGSQPAEEHDDEADAAPVAAPIADDDTDDLASGSGALSYARARKA
jgi:CheY-like chemotaxis protein